MKVGDQVADGQTVVELSTDKVDMELPAPTAGTITEILFEEGDVVTVGQVIARMQAGAGAPSSPAKAEPQPTNGATQAVPHQTRRSPPSPRASPPPRASTSPRSPAAARRAASRSPTSSTPRTATAPSPRASNGTVIKGAAAMLARYMDESRAIPTATSFRTITVTTMDARRKQLKAAGQKVSFTHLIAYAIALAVQNDMPVMAHHFEEVDGKPHRFDDGAVNLGIAVDVEKKDGTRTLMVPVIRDAGRMSFPDFVAAFGVLIDKARTNSLQADDLAGANISLTNPGGIGTISSVPRLMTGQGTIVATGSIAYPVGLGNIGDMIGAEKVMTMTSTYDHRIIQGAESGRFLQVVEGYLQGEHEFYEKVFEQLGAELGPAPQPPAPAAAAAAARDGGDRRQPRSAPTRRCCRPCRPPSRSSRPTAPTATSPRAWTRWAPSPRATPRWSPDRWASPPRSWPRSRPRSCACSCRAPPWPTRCPTCARPTAARSPTRSSTSPATASACGCASASSPAPTASR